MKMIQVNGWQFQSKSEGWNMEEFVKEIRQHLEEQLIPFWEGLKDRKNGGYYGYMVYGLELDAKDRKSVV